MKINNLKLRNSDENESEIIIEHIINDEENYYKFKTKDNEIFRILESSVIIRDKK